MVTNENDVLSRDLCPAWAAEVVLVEDLHHPRQRDARLRPYPTDQAALLHQCPVADPRERLYLPR